MVYDNIIYDDMIYVNMIYNNIIYDKGPFINDVTQLGGGGGQPKDDIG